MLLGHCLCSRLHRRDHGVAPFFFLDHYYGHGHTSYMGIAETPSRPRSVVASSWQTYTAVCYMGASSLVAFGFRLLRLSRRAELWVKQQVK